jgi:hypothetical protein
MASQFSAGCPAFPVEKPFRAAIALPWRRPQTLIFRRNLQRRHGLLSVKWGRQYPKSEVRHTLRGLL